MTRRASQAFTLLELLLVMGIIGIISSIVITAINPGKQLAAAQDARRRSTANQIQKAFEQYLIDSGSYPSDSRMTEGVAIPVCRYGITSDVTCIDITTSGIVPTHLASVPVDPLETNVNYTGYAATKSAGRVLITALHLSTLDSDWVAGWTHRKPIVVSHANVDSDLTDFPVLVRISADTDIGAHARSDGYDLRFANADGNALSYEREDFAVVGGSATGDFWVNVPTISHTADTTMYVYYGKSDASDEQSGETVWDSHFQGVWHLNDAGDATVMDSTANGKNGSNDGVAATSGKIGGAGYTESHSIGVSINVSEVAYTASLWFSTSTARTGLLEVDCNDRGGCGHDRHMYLNGGNVCTRVWSDETICTSGVNYADGQWHHAVLVYGGSVGGQQIFVDGVSRVAGSKSNSDFNWQSGLTIGFSADGGGFLLGSIDEARVSDIARPAAWLKFEYANVSSGSNELMWGSQESR